MQTGGKTTVDLILVDTNQRAECKVQNTDFALRGFCRGRAPPFMIVDLRSKIVFQAREADSEFTLPAPLNSADKTAFVIAESVHKTGAETLLRPSWPIYAQVASVRSHLGRRSWLLGFSCEEA